MRTDAELELRGKVVTLRPYAEERDCAELFGAGTLETFRYFPFAPVEWNAGAFGLWMRAAGSAQGRVTLVVRDAVTGAALGSSSFLETDGLNKAAEIGATWYAGRARGTGVNPECKLLMLGFAFGGGLGEFLGWKGEKRCERVQLKCDARNVQSQRAIEKLGAVREGVLRRHRVCMDGFMRDTVVYSIVRGEWEGVREGLERRVGVGGAGK